MYRGYFEPDEVYSLGWYAAETVNPFNKRELDRIWKVARDASYFNAKYQKFFRFTMTIRNLGAVLPRSHVFYLIESNPWRRSSFVRGFLAGLEKEKNRGRFKNLK